jgi:uncharacterized protein
MFDVSRSGLAGTSIESTVTTLHQIYLDADAAVETWKDDCAVRCPEACGKCCEGFEPDVLPAEAIYLAAILARDGSALFDSIDFTSSGKTCLFFDPENPFHCRIYEGRPLVCRLFGYTGVLDKNGEVSFRLCRHISSRGERIFGEAELRRDFGALPPVMSRFSAMLVSLDPEGASSRLPIRVAAPLAAGKVAMLSRYAGLAWPPSPAIPLP